jgi:hypothetical protein
MAAAPEARMILVERRMCPPFSRSGGNVSVPQFYTAEPLSSSAKRHRSFVESTLTEPMNAARSAVCRKAAGRRAAGLFVVAGLLLCLPLGACGVVKSVDKVAKDVHGNKATVDAFTQKLHNGETMPFEATYVTTGTSPATIVYAVEPPKGLSFTDTQAGSAGKPSVDIVVNSSGEYSCVPPSGAGSWSCEKLDTESAAAENQLFDFYTPSHWVKFLGGFSIAAGFAGDKVTNSSMSVNGFSMQCVDFVASGVPGTSTVCTTSQGILGYVKVASDSTSFEIKSYTASPASSLFQLPPGAKVVTPPTSTT